MGVYTLLYLKWMTGKHLLHSTQNPAQCHVAAWMGCVCVCVCVAESLHWSPGTHK